MYDRTVLHAAAQTLGDCRPVDLQHRLKVARTTAWRLWHGRNAPSAALAVRVEAHYGVNAAQLIKTTAPAVGEQAAI
ncbi:XRE family transcriptional regulator [Streptomyces sp. GQFP]|uniref:XRE family transcriptional regulator n=1 Tax=Streptomyces sp. GQFP TaxID=2907545 RepID=UPI001F2986EF|nr:XRE family transcriptional regulator [Streptomyces sp. GQFP]UIX33578.1 XRE family transcriptional regulator [Streptomyces sp. GQFP]